MRFRLLALDVDGTLLDPEGALSQPARDAVRRACDAGVQVVLCTGRRYRTTRPVLVELGLEGAVIVHNGVLVKDSSSHETLEHRYLSADLLSRALSVLRRNASPLLYVDHFSDSLDIFYETSRRGHPYQLAYLDDHADSTRAITQLDDPPSDALVMLSCMADEDSLRRVEREVHTELGDSVRTHFLENKNYRGHILEVASAGSGKWPALRQLAESRGISPAEIVAIGDDANDVEMIRGAGLGVAMGNAAVAVRDAADRVAPRNGEEGVARAIDRWVLGRH